MTTALSNRLNATPEETAQARLAAQELAEAAPRQWAGEAAGHTVKLGPELSQILTRIVRALAGGGTVTIGSIPEVLTTTTAAELLGISRPTLMKHVAAGELTSHKVGSHTRLKSADVLAFRQMRLQRQRAAAEELLALEDELEIGVRQ
jgi:excisionase family DNA binding protein